jgi:hypothetical protein
MMDAWVELSEKLKSCNDDQAEHSTWGEYAEAWKKRMHKVHRDYKYVEQRREECCCSESDSGM